MHFIRKYKTKGSTMGLALMISLLVTSICSFFLMQTGMNAKTFALYNASDKTINNINSGLELLLAEKKQSDYHQGVWIDLFDNGNDSVRLFKRTWGAFEFISSSALSGKKLISKNALVGSSPFKENQRISLYVCDNGKPISVCGKTKIEGKCYAPSSGFKRAYIEGQNYQGDKFVYGQVINSQAELPQINTTFLKSIQEQITFTDYGLDSIVPFNGKNKTDSIIQEFNQKTLVLHSTHPLYIADLFISGNIILRAPKITIDQSAYLENVLLISDEIEIKEKCNGKIQAIASNTIKIGEGTTLTYPSQLILVNSNSKKAQKNNEDILVAENCIIQGDIICYINQKIQNESFVSLNKNVTVFGNVYVNGKLDTKAKIYGSTFCQKLFLKTNSGIYENHLLNAVFNAAKLSEKYLGASFLEIPTNKEVVQWL